VPFVDLLAAYNRATNRLIAGVRFAVPGATDADTQLRDMIRGMGGHIVDSAQGDVLFTIDADDPATKDGVHAWLENSASAIEGESDRRATLGTPIVVDEIGRASCRERGKRSGVGGRLGKAR